MKNLDRLLRRVKALEDCPGNGRYPAVVIIDVPEDLPTVESADQQASEIKKVSPKTIIIVFAPSNSEGTPSAKNAMVFDKEDRDL